MELTDRRIKLNKRKFQGKQVPEWLIVQAFVDAYDICFTVDKWKYRNIGALFHAVYIGKLGEHIVAEYYRNKGIRCHRPDYYTNNIDGDNGDLIVDYRNNKYRFSIKTCMDYGNLLVERVSHFDKNGVYKKNNIIFNRHYLVRVNQNLTEINYNCSKEQLYNYIKGLNWKAEICGYISHKDFLEVINKGLIIRKGQLNFSSDSYYVQSGDLRKIS